VTAKRAKRLLELNVKAFWQDESYDHLRLPPPAFAIVIFFAAGVEAPAVAEKLTGAPDTLSTGEGGAAAATFSVTFTVCGEPLAPAAATVTVSV
jgi:hypothetical protein